MIRIDVLPDDVLLEIFDFYMIVQSSHKGKTESEAWQSLVHVCRRWRTLVFRSPRRLNLRLYCTHKTPAKDALDIWPALPLIINSDIEGGMALSSDMGNIIAALEQSNRVCEVVLHLAGWQLEKVLAPMQVSIPELTDLRLLSFGEMPPVIPDSFLDGSAPRLQVLILKSISFPGLSKLLLSSTQLVHLYLVHIPHSGYISPEAMAALLSALSSLEALSLRFRSPQSRPDWESQSLPPPKRSILPALRILYFKGVTEYLEELVARIDTPQLVGINITFFNQIDFDCPRLAQYINRTPTLSALDEAHVQFDHWTASVILRYRISDVSFGDLQIDISCEEQDWQLSSIEQICNSSFPSLSTVEDLYIEHLNWQPVWKDDAALNNLWLELLLPFMAVKNLYLSKEFAPGIAAALHELIRGRLTEVFPGLQNIFVERLEPPTRRTFQENIGQFIDARRLLGHHIAIFVWAKFSVVWPM